MSSSPLSVTNRPNAPTPAEPGAAADPRGRSARDARIEANVGLVRAVSRQVAGSFPRHVDREELVRAGMIGLVEAADRFDGTLGVPFASFAARRIRGAMLDSLRAHDWAPRSVRAAARDIDQTEQAMANRLGRTPSTQEVADELGLSTGEVASVRHRETRAVVLTLETFFEDSEGEEMGLADVLCDPSIPDPVEQLETAEMHGYVQDAVSLLPARHRRVIEGYFFGSDSSEEIADELGVTVSRISQLKGEALDMLRDGILAQFAGTCVPAAAPARRRSARAEARQAEYADAIATHRDWRARATAVAVA